MRKNTIIRNSLISGILAIFSGVLLFGANAAFGGDNPAAIPPGDGVSPTFSGLNVTGDANVDGNFTGMGDYGFFNNLLVGMGAIEIDGTYGTIKSNIQDGRPLGIEDGLNVSGNLYVDAIQPKYDPNPTSSGPPPSVVVDAPLYVVGNAKVNKNLQIDEDVQIDGDILPGGTVCPVGNTIKKIADGSWGCVALSFVTPAELESSLTATINYLTELISTQQGGSLWSKVFDAYGNDTGKIEALDGEVVMGPEETVIGTNESILSPTSLQVNGAIETSKGIVVKNNMGITFNSSDEEGTVITFANIMPSKFIFSVMKAMFSIDFASTYGDMVLAGDIRDSSVFVKAAMQMSNQTLESLGIANNAEKTINAFVNQYAVKWFFNQVLLRILDVESYIVNNSVTENGDRDIDNPVLVKDNLNVTGKISSAGVGEYHLESSPNEILLSERSEQCESGTILISCGGRADNGIKSIVPDLDTNTCTVTAMPKIVRGVETNGIIEVHAICFDPHVNLAIAVPE